MTTFLDLPVEIHENIGLSLDFADVVSLMTTCSTLWQFRYNFSFWRHYHQLNHGTTFLLDRLGDPYKSVRRRAYARWILAEKIIDIIYESTSRDSLQWNYAYIYGGYLRDRLARRLTFRDINLSISRDSYDRLRRSINDQLSKYGFGIAPYPDPYDTLIYKIYDKNLQGVDVELKLTLHHVDEIAVDFDINSLYLRDRKTLALRIPAKDRELERIVESCRKRIFGLTHIRLTNLDQLTQRFDYMIKLGFRFIPPKAYLP